MVFRRRDIHFPVTLLYDGDCPVCIREISWLRQQNSKGNLALINFREESFASQYPGIQLEQLDRRLHAVLGNGRVITGVEATFAAWESVGKGWLLLPLTWPGAHCLAEVSYNWFARHRYGIARFLSPFIGPAECSGKSCSKSDMAD